MNLHYEVHTFQDKEIRRYAIVEAKIRCPSGMLYIWMMKKQDTDMDTTLNTFWYIDNVWKNVIIEENKRNLAGMVSIW